MAMTLAPYQDGLPIVLTTVIRNTVFPSPELYQRVHNLETGDVERWTGSAWVVDFGPPPGVLVPNIVDATQMTGVDAGAKIQAAIGSLPSNGGVVDASGLTGTQFLSTDLTLNKHGVSIWFGPMALQMGASRIVVAPAIHGCALYGLGPYGIDQFQGGSGQTGFYYSGGGSPIMVGDASADTYAFLMADIGMSMPGAGNTAVGVYATRLRYGQFDRLNIGLGTGTSQVGMVWDGGGSFCSFNRAHEVVISGGVYGYWLGKSGQVTANAIRGGQYSSGVAGTGTGIYNDATTQWNRFEQVDLENLATGVDWQGSALNNVADQLILAGNTVDYRFAAGARFNRADLASLLGSIADSGAGNMVNVAGGVVLAGPMGQVRAVTGNATLSVQDFTIAHTTGVGDKLLTLPLASSCPGKEYLSKKVDAAAGKTGFQRSGADTIDGATSVAPATNAQYTLIRVRSLGGTSWAVI